MGYNLQPQGGADGRLGALAVVPVFGNPTLFGMLQPHEDFAGFVRNVGVMWLALGVGGSAVPHGPPVLPASDVQTGLVWLTKILTDPFHDVKLYHRAPICTCCAAS